MTYEKFEKLFYLDFTDTETCIFDEDQCKKAYEKHYKVVVPIKKESNTYSIDSKIPKLVGDNQSKESTSEIKDNIQKKKETNVCKDSTLEVKEKVSIPKIRPLPSHIKILKGDEIIEPIDWLIKGFIEKGDTVVFCGDSGTGKTFHLINLCMHLVNGLDFLDCKTEGCGVYYVLGEGSKGFQRRVHAWKLNKGLFNFRFPFAVGSQSYSLDEGTNKFIEEFKWIKKHYPDVKHWVVVFDTLNRNLSPGADENSNAGLGKGINRLINDVKPLGVTVFIAHHTNRNGGPRGFSGLRGNVDCLILTDCKQDVYELETDKVKEGEKGKIYQFTGKKINLNIDGDDDASSLAFEYLGEGKKKVESKSKGKVKNKPSDVARREYLNEFIEAVKAKAESGQCLTDVRLPSWSPSDEWKQQYLFYEFKDKATGEFIKPDIKTELGQSTVTTRLSRLRTYHKEEGNIKSFLDGQNVVWGVTDKGLHQTV